MEKDGGTFIWCFLMVFSPKGSAGLNPRARPSLGRCMFTHTLHIPTHLKLRTLAARLVESLLTCRVFVSIAPNLSPRKQIGLVLQGVRILRGNTRTPTTVIGLLQWERAHSDFISVEDPSRKPPFTPSHALLTLCSTAHFVTLPPSVADYVWDMTGCFSPLFCLQWMGSGRLGECGAAALQRVEVGLRDVTVCAMAPSSVDRLARAPRRSISSAMTEGVLVCNLRPLILSFAWRGLWEGIPCIVSAECNKLWSSQTLPKTQPHAKGFI